MPPPRPIAAGARHVLGVFREPERHIHEAAVILLVESHRGAQQPGLTGQGCENTLALSGDALGLVGAV